MSLYCQSLQLTLQDGETYRVSQENKKLLNAALKQENIALLTFLLVYGIHLDDQSKKLNLSPLHIAIEQQHPVLVKQLVRYNIDVNEYIQRLSPLDKAYSIYNNKQLHGPKTALNLTAIIGILLEAGAIECQEAEPILDLGLKVLKNSKNKKLIQ